MSAPPDDVLRRLDWADVSRRLTKFAHHRLRGTSLETARDIAQHAIADLLDPAYANWDRERHPDPFHALCSIVNSHVANHFARLRRRGPHVPYADDTRDEADPMDPRAEGDEREAHAGEGAVVAAARTRWDREGERGERAMAALRARLKDDTLCLRMLDLIAQQVGRAQAQAEALGVPVDDVYTAKRRIHHHARAVARELDAGGAP